MSQELILVGDDFERRGSEALRQAGAWAERTGARLAVCHAVPELGALEGLLGLIDRDGNKARDAALVSARAALESRVESVLGRPADILHVGSGSPHRVILELAHELGATLLVVGDSSDKGALGGWLGSSAEQIVRHAEPPVLVARPSPPSALVLTATDLFDNDLPALRAAVAESQRRRAELVVAHALDLAHPILASFDPGAVIDEHTAAALREACHRTLSASATRFGREARTEVVEGPAQRAIPELARRLGAELLVIGSHGRHGLERVAVGSIAMAMVRRAPCSVLVVREHRSRP